jgi:hypothetical protein
MDSKSLFGFVSGYKTYLVALGAIGYAIGIHFGWWQHSADIDLAFGGAGAITIRAAIAKLCALVAADPRFKILIALFVVGYSFLGANAAIAGVDSPFSDKNPVTHDVENVVKGASNAHAFTLEVSPNYAPKLTDHQWGLSVAGSYPINDWSYAEVRFDWLAGDYVAGSGSGGLKKDFVFLGRTFTPFAEVGVGAPLNKGGDKNLEPGARVGTGIKTVLIDDQKHRFKLSLFGGVDYWSQYSGIQFYRLGAQGSIAW